MCGVAVCVVVAHVVAGGGAVAVDIVDCDMGVAEIVVIAVLASIDAAVNVLVVLMCCCRRGCG